jgi:hypothetical protein
VIETKGFNFSPGAGARFVESTPVPLRFVDGKTLVPDSGVDFLAKGIAQSAENLLAGVKIGVAGLESGVKTGVNAYTERLKAKEHNDLLREMYGDRDELNRAKLALQERQLSDREAGVIGGRAGSSKTPLDYSGYGLGDGVSVPVADAQPPAAPAQDAQPPFALQNLRLSDFQAAANPELDAASALTNIADPSLQPQLNKPFLPDTKALQEAQLRLNGAGYDDNALQSLTQVAAPPEVPPAPAIADAQMPAPSAPAPAATPAPAQAPSASVNSPFIKVPVAGPDGKPSGYVLFDRVSRKLISAGHLVQDGGATAENPAPAGWQPRTMSVNGKGEVTRTFLSPEEVQKEKDQHEAASDLHNANLNIKQERLAQMQRDGYSKDVAVKTYTGPNGAQQALAAFVPAFNEANDPHNTSKSSSEMSMLDQLVRAETGGKPTETQIHTIRSNMPLKEKLVTLFGKNYAGDFLGKDMYNSLAQQIVGNAANKAKIANGTIEGIRQSYIDHGLEPPKQLKPFVVPMTVKDVNDEISKIRSEALPVAQRYDALTASGKADTDEAKQLKTQLEEHQAEAVRLGKMKANAKHFIVNLDDFLDTSKQGWKGVAVEALTPQAPAQ